MLFRKPGLQQINLRISTVLWVFLSLIPFVAAIGEVPGSGLSQMEAVTARYPTMQNFLNDPKAIEEYFVASQNYFGKQRFGREAYNAIIKQMKDVSTKMPDVAKRLWETSNTGPRFSIETSLRTSGRSMDEAKFSEVISERRKILSDEAQELIKLNGDPLTERITKLTGAVSAAENSLDVSQLKASERRRIQGEHFARVKSMPESKELARYYAFQMLDSTNIKDILSSGDADLVLETLKEMRDNPKAFLPPGTDVPSSVLSEIKSALPDANKLLLNKTVFPDIMRTLKNGQSIPMGGGGRVVYDFVPVPRRIHAAWGGMVLGECVGGHCKLLEWLTPQRWAKSALEGSQHQFLEKGGLYSGFTEATPGSINGKVYASITVGAPDMRKKVIIDDGKGNRASSTLFREWFNRFSAAKPPTWQGLVISGNSDIDNAGVKNTVKNSSSYLLGTSVNPLAENFEVSDPLAKKISEAYPSKHYSDGNMILDATTPNSRRAGDLRLLSLVTETEMTSNPRHILELLKDPSRDSDTILILRQIKDPSVLKAVVPRMREVLDFGIRGRVFLKAFVIETGIIPLTEEIVSIAFTQAPEKRHLQKAILGRLAKEPELLKKLSPKILTLINTGPLESIPEDLLKFAIRERIVPITLESASRFLTTGSAEVSSLALAKLSDGDWLMIRDSLFKSSSKGTTHTAIVNTIYARDPNLLDPVNFEWLKKNMHQPGVNLIQFSGDERLMKEAIDKGGMNQVVRYYEPGKVLPVIIDYVRSLQKGIEFDKQGQSLVFRALAWDDPNFEVPENRRWFHEFVRQNGLSGLKGPEQESLVLSFLRSHQILEADETVSSGKLQNWLLKNPREITPHWMTFLSKEQTAAILARFPEFIEREKDLEEVAKLFETWQKTVRFNTELKSKVLHAKISQHIADAPIPLTKEIITEIKNLIKHPRLFNLSLPRLENIDFPSELRSFLVDPDPKVREIARDLLFFSYGKREFVWGQTEKWTELLQQKKYGDFFRAISYYNNGSSNSKALATTLEAIFRNYPIRDPEFDRILIWTFTSKNDQSAGRAVLAAYTPYLDEQSELWHAAAVKLKKSQPDLAEKITSSLKTPRKNCVQRSLLSIYLKLRKK